MDKLNLKAEKRKLFGRKVKRLRREGILPANIYGKSVKSQAVQVNLADFEKIYSKAGETNLVELMLSAKKFPVLIHKVQLDPVKDKPIHTDFLQVNLKEKVTADVPIELVGEAPAEKQGLGTVVQHIDEIGVEAFPANLPDKFEIDLTGLVKVDDLVQVKDISVDVKKVEINTDSEQIIVKIEPLRKEEEVKEEKPEVKEEGKEAEKETTAEATREEKAHQA